MSLSQQLARSCRVRNILEMIGSSIPDLDAVPHFSSDRHTPPPRERQLSPLSWYPGVVGPPRPAVPRPPAPVPAVPSLPYTS